MKVLIITLFLVAVSYIAYKIRVQKKIIKSLSETYIVTNCNNCKKPFDKPLEVSVYERVICKSCASSGAF